ncbi:hypothetical protein H0A73_18010 [Alcaligenaceae bacterium]|nr:hypothetical protein [Alcaligenaceae bacterium]
MESNSSVPSDWITVHMDIDEDILIYFQSPGPDREVRINDALRDWLKTHRV